MRITASGRGVAERDAREPVVPGDAEAGIVAREARFSGTDAAGREALRSPQSLVAEPIVTGVVFSRVTWISLVFGQYVEFFDPGFVGLTGSEEEIEDIARRYGAQFVIPEGQPEDSYLVNHSTVAYLIDPLGYVRALYYGDEPIDAIAANVRGVLEELG